MIATVVDATPRTAVVSAPDGVRFTATATSEDVEAQLADYVASRCADVLWPAAAADVRCLIAEGRLAEAIEAYFANVGQRWDDEWLEVTAGL